MGFLKNNHVAKTLILGQTHFGKLMVELCFSKKCCVVTLLFMIIYMKVHILIAYGELHDLLAWKRIAS